MAHHFSSLFRAGHLLPVATAAIVVLVGGCSETVEEGVYQGYLEADYRYMAAPVAGYVDALPVQRGEQVEAGALLFTLDTATEQRRLEQARAERTAAEARLHDARKGAREPEIQALRSAADAIEADLQRLRLQLERQQTLVDTGASPQENLDDARLTEQRVAAQLRQARAQLEQADLPARSDVIDALTAQVEAARAAEALAQWQVDQAQQSSPIAAVVEDVLYRPGEWVAAGKPVVVLYPPADVLAYFYVSDTDLPAIREGATVEIIPNGAGEALSARIDAVSSDPEYTPPVIFSNETRGKLLYRVEARLEPGATGNVHPGQPVRVRIGKAL